MIMINAYEYAFPVVGGHIQTTPTGTKTVIKQVYGTAFSVEAGCFLTAAHVIHAACENEYAGIAYADNDVWRAFPFLDFETLDEHDLGMVKTAFSNSKSLKWSFDQLPMLRPVRSVGYPYSLDLEHFVIIIRSFAGYVVSTPTFHRLKASPRVYELSFQCPRGLSGAPLLVTEGENQGIVGIVIGNKATQMLVYSDKEVNIDERQETIVERYEALQLGIAIQSDSLRDIHFQILDNTLYNHLAKNDLIEA